jgi:plastocyanin
MTPRNLPLLVTPLIVAFALAGCGGDDDKSSSSPAASAKPTGGAQKVDIPSFKYVPATATVKAGSAVTFTNGDSAEHTATADQAGAFDTGALRHGAAKAVQLSAPGRYAYHCDFHPFMHGVLVVR